MCKEWNEGMPQILSEWSLAFLHGMKYTGPIWGYCPWCGQKLRAGICDDETAAMVSVDYDEFMPHTYRGYVVTMCTKNGVAQTGDRFCTGAPYADEAAALDFAKSRGVPVHIASSVNNFKTDALQYFVGKPMPRQNEV